MLLPTIENASIDIRKLAEYVLNSSHPEGRHKARVFLAAIGLGAADAEWLSARVLAGLRHSEAVLQSNSSWGPIYRVDMDIVEGKGARRYERVGSARQKRLDLLPAT
jgi:hypothetical protein